MFSVERELDWCGGHAGSLAGGGKPEHNWVAAGGKQLKLPEAESSHDFKVQLGEIVTIKTIENMDCTDCKKKIIWSTF